MEQITKKEVYLQVFKDTDGEEKIIMNKLTNSKMIEIALNLLDIVKQDYDKTNPASKVAFSLFCMRLGAGYEKVLKERK